MTSPNASIGDSPMRSRFLTILSILLMLTGTARAADWFRLGNSEFAARVPVTINNPGEADDPAVFVSIDLTNLSEIMPEASANTVAVADETHQIVPFQISTMKKSHLQFVLPVKAHTKRTVYVYAAKDPIQIPRFEPRTSTDIREAYRSFENEFQAFRIEIGDKAKTTGLA